MSRKKKIVFTVAAALLFLLFAEAVARFAVNYGNRLGNFERRKTFEAYQDKEWAGQYFEDIEDCAAQRGKRPGRFVRYLMFDLGPDCATQTVNYAGGTRKTWEPEIVPDDKAKIYKIGMFGGSTMLGLGTPDDLTIPSHLSRLLHEAGGKDARYLVTNYGVSSYDFTQGLMKLTLLLREGERFDYVIFYGGTNDIDNSYEAGRAGALYAEKAIRNKLEGGLRGQLREFIKDQLNSCGLCKGLAVLSRNTPFLEERFTPFLVRARDFIHFKEGAGESEGDIARFAEEIAANYRQSHDLLAALARAYGFRYAEFLQPTLLYNDHPVGGEEIIRNVDTRLSDEKLLTLYRETYEKLLAMRLANFFDASDSLLGRQKAFYVDAVHINDEGNAAVAERVFAALKKELGLQAK